MLCWLSWTLNGLKWLVMLRETWFSFCMLEVVSNRFAHIWLIREKPLLYSCCLLFDDATSMVDFHFWTFRNFHVEYWMMNAAVLILCHVQKSTLVHVLLFVLLDLVMRHDDDCLLQLRELCLGMFLLVLFWCLWQEAHWDFPAVGLMMIITWW